MRITTHYEYCYVLLRIATYCYVLPHMLRIVLRIPDENDAAIADDKLMITSNSKINNISH